MRAVRLCAWAVAGVCLLLPPGATASNTISGSHDGLVHTLQTDRALYVAGEVVEVCYAVENVTDEPIQLEQSQCGCPLWVAVFVDADSLVWCVPCGCPDEICSDLLEPGESYVLEFTWDMENYWTGHLTETRGMHRVNGRLSVYEPEFKYELDLDIAILDDETGAPEPGDGSSWSIIKALYR